MTVPQMMVVKSSPNVHLDWSLDGTSGPFVLKRSLSFTFSNPVYLGPGQTTKTFDDAVLNNGQSYAYEAFRRTLTDTLYFYHADHLGTPIAMSNGAGTLVWRAEHTPFGGIYTLTVGTTANNLRFPGQYFDGETGLAQNYFRDYNNRTGRYWEPDPLMQDQYAAQGFLTMARNFSSFGSSCSKADPASAFNLFSRSSLEETSYSYCHNLPTVLVDPAGLFSCDCYRDLCRKTHCRYYCKFAIPACEFFRHVPIYGAFTTECIGICLQIYDAVKCAPKQGECSDCSKISQCNSNGHVACYLYCFVQYGGR